MDKNEFPFIVTFQNSILRRNTMGRCIIIEGGIYFKMDPFDSRLEEIFEKSKNI